MTTRPLMCLVGALTCVSLMVASAAALSVSPVQLAMFAHADTVPTTTCTVPASAFADTYTNEGAITTNYGDATDLRIASMSLGAKRLFIRADLRPCSIPTTAVVQTATLGLHLTAAPSTSRTYNAFRLSSAWDEATLTWASTQPSTAGTATATTASGTTAGTRLRWDVTTDAQTQVSTPTSNHGWTIRDANESGLSRLESAFGSRTDTATDRRPSLVVVYYP